MYEVLIDGVTQERGLTFDKAHELAYSARVVGKRASIYRDENGRMVKCRMWNSPKGDNIGQKSN